MVNRYFTQYARAKVSQALFLKEICGNRYRMRITLFACSRAA